uniref:GSVIVT01008074001 n=1 Tax=Arundo donax TaxID=35708 RepID=A0A0A9EDK0_ARUDO
MVPSFRIAIIRTINGGKSNSHMSASSINPSTIRIVIETA